MAKVDAKIHAARMSGAAWIVDFIEKNGMDAAKLELKRRGAQYIPMEIDNDRLRDFEYRVKCNTIDSVVILTAAVLRDEFGFGQQRLDRFMERFDQKTDCIYDGDVTFMDYAEVLKEETGIELEIRRNE